jgi:hypothetical protein
MVVLYRGTKLSKANTLLATGNQRTNFNAGGNGEFGNGCYLWLADKKAAFISAVQLVGAKPTEGGGGDWAVVSVTLDDDALRQAMVVDQSRGPRVLEFLHGLPSPFKDDQGQPRKDSHGRAYATNYVVPWQYSHTPQGNETAAAADTRATGNLTNLQNLPPKENRAALAAIGRMDTQSFRKINADPVYYAVQGQSNVLDWQYDMIIGLCAVDYEDKNLVQVKLAHFGLTHVNNSGTRAIVLTGKQVVTARQKVLNWKFATRDHLWELYAEGRTSLIKLDDLIT